jgi:hypothetical protein
VQLLARAHDAAGFRRDPKIMQMLEVHDLVPKKICAG